MFYFWDDCYPFVNENIFAFIFDESNILFCSTWQSKINIIIAFFFQVLKEIPYHPPLGKSRLVNKQLLIYFFFSKEFWSQYLEFFNLLVEGNIGRLKNTKCKTVVTSVFKMRFWRWTLLGFGKGIMHIFDLFISSRDSLWKNK